MNLSTRILAGTGAVVMMAGAMLFAQPGDAAKVMADMRKALGGEQKLAAIKTLSATGKSQRSLGETSSGGDYELMLELPDKFFTKQVLAQTPMGTIAMKMGFNGESLIQETEQPQMPGGGGMQIRFGGSTPNASPEQLAADRVKMAKTSKQDFARMALGMFGASFGAYPLEFTYGGVAEAPDGKADVINVKGPDDFAGKLFVDQKTHLPLMFSWMAKEPLQMTAGTRAGGGGQAGVVQMNHNMSAEEREKTLADAQARMAEAEKNRKMVEFRMFYSNYQSVDGIQLPHTFQQATGDKPSTEVTIEKYKINPKIDGKKFDAVK
jgi:hypothetical protein